MPELPEVEVLVRHLDPLLRGRRIRSVDVFKDRIIRPHPASELRRAVEGREILQVTRRAKFIRFHLVSGGVPAPADVIAHLGMTGRIHLESSRGPMRKHAVVSVNLGTERLVFEDARQFGHFRLASGSLGGLGPEPLDGIFTPSVLGDALAGSRQAVKIRMMDQAVIAGIGNIYASEALFLAGVSPRTPSSGLDAGGVARLCHSIRAVLDEAIERGMLMEPGRIGDPEALFHRPIHGGTGGSVGLSHFRVYDREGHSCTQCRSGVVERIVQAGRCTYFCSRCQPEAGRVAEPRVSSPRVRIMPRSVVRPPSD